MAPQSASPRPLLHSPSAPQALEVRAPFPTVSLEFTSSTISLTTSTSTLEIQLELLLISFTELYQYTTFLLPLLPFVQQMKNLHSPSQRQATGLKN